MRWLHIQNDHMQTRGFSLVFQHKVLDIHMSMHSLRALSLSQQMREMLNNKLTDTRTGRPTHNHGCTYTLLKTSGQMYYTQGTKYNKAQGIKCKGKVMCVPFPVFIATISFPTAVLIYPLYTCPDSPVQIILSYIREIRT